jgi:hypothetical protein
MALQRVSCERIASTTPEALSSTPLVRGFQRPIGAWYRSFLKADCLHSALCESCKNMLNVSRILQNDPASYVKSDHEIYQHYQTFDHVRYAASSGCHLCALAWLSHAIAMPWYPHKIKPKNEVPRHDWGASDLGYTKVHIHAFDPSKFRPQEKPYLSLRWRFTSYPQDTSHDLRIYRVPTTTHQSGSGFVRIQSEQVILDEQLNHCMIPRSRSTDSSDSFLLASWWLHSCLHSHQVCSRRQASPGSVPGRLLYVGQNASSVVRVCEVDAHDMENVPKYLTLSHCWGHSRKLRLTESTLEAYLHAIPVEELARTVKDAIEITRRLGYQYI